MRFKWISTNGVLNRGARHSILPANRGMLVCVLVLAAVSNVVGAQESGTSEDKAKEALIARINALADKLEKEAAMGKRVANDMTAAPHSETHRIYAEASTGPSGMGKLLKSHINDKPLGDISWADDTTNALVLGTVKSDAENLTGYAKHLRGISADAKSASLDQILKSLTSAYVPESVAIVISPGTGSHPANGALIPFSSADEQQVDTSTGLIPFIVGMGETTVDYPAVAALLYTDPDTGGLSAACTGTLVAPDIILTAQHCVVQVEPVTAYFQHAGSYSIKAIQKYSPYAFPAGDLALLFLTTPVVGVTPIALNADKEVPAGTLARIVGYGYHNDMFASGSARTLTGSGLIKKTGIKIIADVTTAKCEAPNANLKLICWTYVDATLSPLSGSTCKGDSGGPLFIMGDHWSLAGVTSGGKTCEPGDKAVDTEVFDYMSWIKKQIASHHPSRVANQAKGYRTLLPTLNDSKRYVLASSDRIFDDSQSWTKSFVVDSNQKALRVAVNATSSGSSLHLIVGADQGAVACDQKTDDTAISCEVGLPKDGKWSVTVGGLKWQEYQVVATVF